MPCLTLDLNVLTDHFFQLILISFWFGYNPSCIETRLASDFFPRMYSLVLRSVRQISEPNCQMSG